MTPAAERTVEDAKASSAAPITRDDVLTHAVNCRSCGNPYPTYRCARMRFLLSHAFGDMTLEERIALDTEIQLLRLR